MYTPLWLVASKLQHSRCASHRLGQSKKKPKKWNRLPVEWKHKHQQDLQPRRWMLTGRLTNSQQPPGSRWLSELCQRISSISTHLRRAHPHNPTSSSSCSRQADSSLHRSYLGTADQGLLNISKVKSVIHGGDKRSLLGTGPIFEETFHASCRSKSVCVCEWVFFWGLPTVFITVWALLLLQDHQMWSINDQAPQVAAIHPSQRTSP